MIEPNYYEIAKRQIEIDFEAETEGARARRQMKLAALEQLKPTLENATGSPAAKTFLAESQKNRASGNQESQVDPISTSQRIRDEIKLFGDNERFSMPLIFERLSAKYSDIKQMKPANARSLIATVLNKMLKKNEIFLLIKGSSSAPNIYTRRPTLLVAPSFDLFNSHPSIAAGTNGDFVLSKAARQLMQEFNGQPFDVENVYGLLIRDYPDKITPVKKGSISATVSNLYKKGGLEKIGVRNGRMTYRLKPGG